jgi:hypothetical protein
VIKLFVKLEDDKLTEAVRGYGCLWEMSSRTYKDLRAKENAWKEVAEMVRKCFVHKSFL